MGRIEVGRMDNPFVITSVCRTDVIQAFEEKGKTKAREIARCLTDDEMTWVARKMSDDYCNQLFWQSLRIMVEAIIERRSMKENYKGYDIEKGDDGFYYVEGDVSAGHMSTIEEARNFIDNTLIEGR